MNDKIAKWILNGLSPRHLNTAERKAYGVFTYRNNKPVDDSDAIVLLPVLVDRGFTTLALFYDGGWMLKVGDKRIYSGTLETRPAIAEAICSAVVKIIDEDAESI